MVGTTPMMRFYLSLYLFVAAVYLLSASDRLGLSDGVSMSNVAQSVVRERSLSASQRAKSKISAEMVNVTW